MPYHCDDPRVSKWAMETLDELMQEASSRGPVELIHTVVLKRQHDGPLVQHFVSGETPLPEWTSDHRLDFQHLTTEMLSWQNQVYKLKIPSEKELTNLGYMHAWFFRAPIVDSPRKLQQMLMEIENHDNTMSIDVDGCEFESLQDMINHAAELGCDALVNCTGAASSMLCNDSSIVGARGIVLNFDRETCKRREFRHDATGEIMMNDAVILTDEAPWATETEPCYLIPRGNVLVVGGSYLEGDTETDIRPNERKRLLNNARHVGIDVNESTPSAEWVGFRPVRETVRCEIDDSVGQQDGVTVVHNYGHGGSGWTVNVGAAKQVARLLLGDE